MSAPAPTKRLFIKTYGCQMNVYDSERMADVLSPLGYAMIDSPEGADLVVLNTCHIREKATEKVYSELGKLKEMREATLAQGGARMTIAVAGCVAQAEGEEIMRRQPAVDFRRRHVQGDVAVECVEHQGRRNADGRQAADHDGTALFPGFHAISLSMRSARACRRRL